MKDEKFFVGQKAFIEKAGKILVLTDPVEGLDFPGGKIQEEESDVLLSLKREVKEETNLEIEVFEPFYTKKYIFPKSSTNPNEPVFLVAYRCKYVSGDVQLSSEHSNYRWVSAQDYKAVNDGTTFFEMLQKYFT